MRVKNLRVREAASTAGVLRARAGGDAHDAAGTPAEEGQRERRPPHKAGSWGGKKQSGDQELRVLPPTPKSVHLEFVRTEGADWGLEAR